MLVALEALRDEPGVAHFEIEVVDVDADPVLETRNLIAAATRRRLASMVSVTGADQLRAITEARVSLDQIDDPERADLAAEALLGWLQGGSEGSE